MAVIATGSSGVVAAPTFCEMATFCPTGYGSRPGSSQHNGEVLNPTTAAFSLRSGYPHTVEANQDGVSSFLNALNYNGGQSCPSRNFSEPTLFPSLSLVNRTIGSDLSGTRVNSANTNVRLTNDSLAASIARTTGNIFSSNLNSDPGNTASSRGVKLDPSEFPPILTAVGRGGGGTFQSAANQPPLRNYVSVMSKGSLGSESNTGPLSQQVNQITPEFSKQDFPALPGQHTPSPNTSTSASSLPTVTSTSVHRALSNNSSLTPGSIGGSLNLQRPFTQSSGVSLVPSFQNSLSNTPMGTGIQLLPNHLVANIPKNMICDQFGMVGLLKLIRVGDYDATLNMLAPGLDLSTLHSNWQSQGELHSTFVSPCHDSCIGRPQDMDYAVPPEYLIRHLVADRLPDPPLDQLSEETLFWLFYNCCREEAQLVVAKELYQREWRFHKKEQIWLTRIMGANFTTDSTSEQGEYYFWDPFKAQKLSHQMTILYADLDDAPASFRLSSNTLSAFVGIGHPMGGTGGVHHLTGPHSSSHTNAQQQQLSGYSQSQNQSTLNRHQVAGSSSLSTTGSHQPSSQLTAAPTGSASAAALANLFNARAQTKPPQISPNANYFQPSHHNRNPPLVPLFTSRSVSSGGIQSNTPSVSPAVALCSVSASSVTTTTPALAGSSSSANTNSALAVADVSLTNAPTQNAEESGSTPSNFDGLQL